MLEIIILWFSLLSVFTGVSVSYYLYLRKITTKSWNLKTDKNNLPTVTIMVPLFNEEKTIRFKLENLAKLEYPREKLQVLLVNDASTDGTLEEISRFSKLSSMSLTTVNLPSRTGKTRALNTALEHVKGDIVVVSDSDAFISHDALRKAMPYFADPSIGGIISKEELLDPDISWVSQTENLYYKLSYGTIKLGESKIHSTLIFHGGFAAYRKALLDNFNAEADDTGTALDIVQKGSRTIMIPEVISYSLEFAAWKDKFNAKVRRARHNINTWFRSLNLLLRRKLLLPKRIAVPEILLYLFNPLILLTLFVVTIYVLAEASYFAIFLASATVAMLIFKQTRLLFVEVLQNNLFLLVAIFSTIFKNDLIRWETSQDSRTILVREMLESKDLIYCGANWMERTRSSIMDEVREQVRRRLSLKYNWKRTPSSVIEKMQRRLGRMFFSMSRITRDLNNHQVNLGIDDLGRDVASGLKLYVYLLSNRGVQLHTLIVLGSRVKSRAKSESDIDVTIIASNLPGKSSPEFSNIPQKVLNIRRYLLLTDAPIFMGIQPSACCSKEEFLGWLDEFKVSALDAVCYGKVIYDDGFWKHVLTKFREILDKYQLDETNLRELLMAL